MKLLSWKKFLIISLGLSLVVFGIIILFRQKHATVQPESKRYPHEHLQTSALEPRAKLHTIDYTIRDGEALAGIAKLRYGHQHYHRIIKLYNHLDDEGQITAHYTLRLPDVSVILAEEGLTKVAAREIDLILCSRAKYDKIVDQLWALRIQPSANRQLPEDVRRELLEAADDLQQATQSLKLAKPGVSAMPGKMIGQLEQSMTGMKELADGKNSDPNGYDIDMVQQRYALALTYAIIWTREGFK
jgi:hypothetical protein